MAHPFFEVITFPFNREEGKALYNILKQAEKNIARIRNIYDQCAANLPSLTLSAGPDNLWDEVLRNLTSFGALKNLCDLIKIQFAGQQLILDAINAVEKAKSASEKKIFSKDIFILDCDGPREAINKITEDSTAKVLLIRGKKKSGKTHCRYIFESIAKEKDITPVYLYDPVTTTVEDVIKSIFSSMGVADSEIPKLNTGNPLNKNTTNYAWYKEVCTKLKQLATQQGKKTWIVADDLGYVDDDKELGPILDEEIRRFFELFALFLMDPSFAKYFRLLLISYAEQGVPTNWKEVMWMEISTDENSIQQIHVEGFLKEWKTEEKKDMLDQELITLAGEIIALAANPPAEIAKLSRPERIHRILTGKLDEIKRRAS